MIVLCLFVFFFKQKTAYEMRISDWSSDVCSSDFDRDRVIAARKVDRGPWRQEAARRKVARRIVQRAERRDRQRLDAGSAIGFQIGRASCRERVCQYV